MREVDQDVRVIQQLGGPLLLPRRRAAQATCCSRLRTVRALSSTCRKGHPDGRAAAVADALPDADCSEDLCSRSFSLYRYARDGARQEAHEAAKFLFNYILPFHAARNVPDAPRPASGGRGRASVQGQLIRTWKEINATCVEHKEFRLAKICTLHIIVNSNEYVLVDKE